jgi:membrane protein
MCALSVVLSVALGVIGGLLLKAFYSMVRQVSPRSYTYTASHLERSRGKVAVQYAMFRVLPVFVVSLGIVVTAVRLGLDEVVSLVVCTVLFILLSSVRSIVGRMAAEGGGSAFHALLQSISVVVTIVVAYCAYRCSSALATFVPDPSEFVNAVWTAVFVGVVYCFISDVTRRSSYVDIEERIELVVRDIGGGLWEWARSAAEREGVPWCVIGAIILVEVSERPAWMRYLERLGSGILLNKVTMSFGVTQEQSRIPLSDKEAILRTICSAKRFLGEETVTTLKKVTKVRFADLSPDEFQERNRAFEDVRRFAMRRNPDSHYGNMVSQFAREMNNLGK